MADLSGMVAKGGAFPGQGRAEVTDASELLAVDTYLEHILQRMPSLEPIELRVTDALGLVLAEQVSAREPIPAFANSAMDGYALVAGDVADARHDAPVSLRLAGEVAAGAAELPTVEAGVAVRIMTGAPLPPGADAVVPVELTREDAGEVAVHRRVDAGAHVRRIGEDVQAGQRLLASGHRLRPADVGLLAAVGVPRVRCLPAPRVVIVSTGDELVSPDQVPGPGQIRDANGPMLAALARQAGALPFQAGIVPDDRKALLYAFDSNLGHADMIVATGGVSAGVYDLVKDVLESLGDVGAFKVAMKPGMPQVFGKIAGVPVFGLPGNPVSSFVSFEVFVRPAIRALQGRRDRTRPLVTATFTEAVSTPAHKRTYLRVKLRREGREWFATPTGSQGSHVLTSVVQADGLAEIPEEVTTVRVGDPARVHLLVER